MTKIKKVRGPDIKPRKKRSDAGKSRKFGSVVLRAPKDETLLSKIKKLIKSFHNENKAKEVSKKNSRSF